MAYQGRKKLPKDPRRRKQVKTFTKKYGRNAYSIIGTKGGHASPNQWDSEAARKASLRSWEVRRERQAAAEKEKQKKEKQHENNQPNEQEQIN